MKAIRVFAFNYIHGYFVLLVIVLLLLMVELLVMVLLGVMVYHVTWCGFLSVITPQARLAPCVVILILLVIRILISSPPFLDIVLDILALASCLHVRSWV